MREAIADLAYHTKRFLGEHPVLRWFVVPIVFMAGLGIGLMSLFGASPLETTQIVILYITASLLAVAVGLVLERVIGLVVG